MVACQFELERRWIGSDDRVGNVERNASELAQLVTPHLTQALAIATYHHARWLRVHEERKTNVTRTLSEK